MPITETARVDPGSAYGESKLAMEWALRWADRVHGLQRGWRGPEGRLGEDHDRETHLIPLATDAALGRRPPLTYSGRTTRLRTAPRFAITSMRSTSGRLTFSRSAVSTRAT
jgi:UDP-glucose 4-epimerase